MCLHQREVTVKDMPPLSEQNQAAPNPYNWMYARRYPRLMH